MSVVNYNILYLFFALAICLGGTPKLTKVTFKSKLTNKKNDFNFVYKKIIFYLLKVGKIKLSIQKSAKNYYIIIYLFFLPV